MSTKQMNTKLKAIIAISALAGLSGCVAVPADTRYYEPAPAVVYVPPPVVYGPRYYGPPAYYGPSVRFGFYGGYGRGYYGGRRWH